MLFKELGEVKKYAPLKSEAIFIGFSKASRYSFVLHFLLDAYGREYFIIKDTNKP